MQDSSQALKRTWLENLSARLKSLCENLDFHKVPFFDNEVKSFTFTESGIRKRCGNCIFSSFHTDSSAVPKGSPAQRALAPEVSLALCVFQRFNPNLSG